MEKFEFTQKQKEVVEYLFQFLSRDIQLAVKMAEHYTVVNALMDNRAFLNTMRNYIWYNNDERIKLTDIRRLYINELVEIYEK